MEAQVTLRQLARHCLAPVPGLVSLAWLLKAESSPVDQQSLFLQLPTTFFFKQSDIHLTDYINNHKENLFGIRSVWTGLWKAIMQHCIVYSTFWTSVACVLMSHWF